MFSVIALLALYAIVLCVQLWKVKRIEAVKTVEEQQWVDNQKKETQESIDILVRCLLQDQLSLTEAAIRVSGLAKVLKLTEVEQQFYIPFDNLAMATSHIPILADWGKLSAKEQKRFHDERGIIEGEYKDKILEAAERLHKLQ
jgi:hypothetical protein